MGTKLQYLRKAGYILHTIAILIMIAISTTEDLPLIVYNIVSVLSGFLHSVAYVCEKLKDHYEEINEKLDIISVSMSKVGSIDIPFKLNMNHDNVPYASHTDDDETKNINTNRSTECEVITTQVKYNTKTGEIMQIGNDAVGFTPRSLQLTSRN